MNNLEILKQSLLSEEENTIKSFFNITIDDINNLTPEKIADIC